MADEAKSAGGLAVLLCKARTPTQVRQIKDEVVDGIAGILEGRCNGKPLAMLEEGEEDPPARGGAVGVSQPQLPPRVGG